MALQANEVKMDWRSFASEWEAAALRRDFESDVLIEDHGLKSPCAIKGSASLPCIYLSSGIHGDEPAGPQALLGLLKEGFFSEAFHWLICPMLNPTGLEAGSRDNEQGLDLNRDYRLCQTREVTSHIQWLSRQPIPDLFLSLHEDWESSGFYYYEINLGVEGPQPEQVLEAASAFFAPEPESVIDGHRVDSPGWIYHSQDPDVPDGWPEAIYLAKRKCPLSLTFETPSSAPLAKRVACHQAVVREAVKRFQAIIG